MSRSTLPAALSTPTRVGTNRPELASGHATSTRPTHTQPTTPTTSTSGFGSATSPRCSGGSASSFSETTPAPASSSFLRPPARGSCPSRFPTRTSCRLSSVTTKNAVEWARSARNGSAQPACVDVPDPGHDILGQDLSDLPPGVPGGGIPTGIQISMPESTACRATTTFRSAPRCGSQGCRRRDRHRRQDMRRARGRAIRGLL